MYEYSDVWCIVCLVMLGCILRSDLFALRFWRSKLRIWHLCYAATSIKINYAFRSFSAPQFFARRSQRRSKLLLASSLTGSSLKPTCLSYCIIHSRAVGCLTERSALVNTALGPTFASRRRAVCLRISSAETNSQWTSENFMKQMMRMILY